MSWDIPIPIIYLKDDPSDKKVKPLLLVDMTNKVI